MDKRLILSRKATNYGAIGFNSANERANWSLWISLSPIHNVRSLRNFNSLIAWKIMNKSGKQILEVYNLSYNVCNVVANDSIY